MPATDIDEVLTSLAAIVADTTARRDPLGYFAALYRQVTLRVKQGITEDAFDDGPRMARFDAQFANAYLTAYEQFRANQQPSRAWKLAFERTRSDETIILQDLLLAINAHINLDLGVVTGTAFTPAKLGGFHDDFNRINDILAALIPLARNAVETFSPRLAELTAIGGPEVELTLQFSVDAARDEAWRAGTLVSNTPRGIRPLLVDTFDARTKLLGRLIATPAEPVRSAVRHIRQAESADVPAIIAALDALA
ncbi:hypothetical protein HZU40_28615 [Mycolicibacterium fluoranthenivorans]|jgi:hypothetical protein|uniref:Uncharacterized protein n=1 Tax=Mycolicibacterium fluoranthenivorans TaxID=258505 RepID=A0A1G4WXV9_9MYCO|nr:MULTISPECIES: DUF5995 family protein [Mycobacteriaceae]MCV7255868.1 hypothetical protein [Mycobacterium hackensackense]QNJ92088.1 hypothetical protein HZU40_28615 [Mycolicibacterium fluoranthenivorans]SCX32017.1 hypothetical protein SAMN02799620_05489 [Mycolicibacterium fluoranthenivorans]